MLFFYSYYFGDTWLGGDDEVEGIKHKNVMAEKIYDDQLTEYTCMYKLNSYRIQKQSIT